MILTARLADIHAALPQTKLALFTVPDVTSIPFVTTFPPFTVDTGTGQPVALIGPSGPLGPGDHVLLTAAGLIAAGNGIPIGGYNYVNPAQPGNGNPLPDQVVLDAGESASLQTTVDAYNASIRAKAATYGAAVVDLNGLLRQANTTGVRFQGTTYTTAYIKGGLFSLDGVHPTDLAYGFIANLMIDAVNAQFGAHIPEVNLSGSATISASRLAPVSRDGKFYPVIEGGGGAVPAATRADARDRLARAEPVTSGTPLDQLNRWNSSSRTSAGGSVPPAISAVWKRARSKRSPRRFRASSRSARIWSLPTR